MADRNSARWPRRLFCLLLVTLAVLPCRAQKATGPERWEKVIRAFEEQDRQQPPPQNAILFVGSSSIRLWDLQQSFPDLQTINRGFGGSVIADVLHFAERIVVPYRPKVIVFYAGDNDIARGTSPRQVAEDFNRFVQLVHKQLPETKILFIAIKPSIRRWQLADKMKQANEAIGRMAAADPRVELIDIWTPMLGADGTPRRQLFRADGLHLNADGYKLWVRLLKPHLTPSAAPHRSR